MLLSLSLSALLCLSCCGCFIYTQTFSGSDAHVSALREAHFGENLTEAGLDITPKFVKAFQRNVEDDLLIHLVYRFEGISLEHLLYGGQNRLWWNWLKTTQEGENAIKGIMFQLVSLSEALS